MWVKICANTNVGDARLAAEMGADAVGFVFAPSKRQVTAEQVAAITRELPAGKLWVGVFASQDDEEIFSAVELAGLGAVQLHSRYSPGLIERLHGRNGEGPLLIQVVPVEVGPVPGGGGDSLAETLEEALGNPKLWAVLLDAAQAGSSGGLGVAFSWERVAPLLRSAVERARRAHQQAGTTPPKLLLAGGLRPENVAEAIRTLEPDGVDVASGVEASPGRKDPERMAAFIAAARSAGERASMESSG